MADVVNRIIDTIKEAESDGPSSTTYIVDLDYDDKGNRWAVVLGWVDYDGDDEYELWGKIAYLPKNSYMKEYDWDWLMPYDEETGEVWDTEISNPGASDASWWLDQWELIKKEYINAQDKDIESSTKINCVGHNDYKSDELYYSDNFCTMRYLGDGYALYTDRSGDYFPVPLRWAEKIIDLFSHGDIKKACHYIDMAKEKQPKDFSYDKYVNSSTAINCVGHNDPGQYYDLIDYFDVYYDGYGEDDDFGGWKVNNLGPIEEHLWIPDDITEDGLLDFLKDIGYLNKDVKLSDVIFDWEEPYFIEITQAKDYYPIGRLQKSYEQ